MKKIEDELRGLKEEIATACSDVTLLRQISLMNSGAPQKLRKLQIN